MTLHQYILRRSRIVWITGGSGVLTVWIVAARAPKDSLWALAASVAPPLFFLVVANFSGGLRCPRCHARLGYLDVGSRRFGRAPRPGLDRCLNCGLHPREEIPTGS
ncbi:MAG: hypothetical protein JSR66_01215 [Proteobacteria bacterium]|nr:hypothetical protein [Pseudomonadota bacterium]